MSAYGCDSLYSTITKFLFLLFREMTLTVKLSAVFFLFNYRIIEYITGEQQLTVVKVTYGVLSKITSFSSVSKKYELLDTEHLLC